MSDEVDVEQETDAAAIKRNKKVDNANQAAKRGLENILANRESRLWLWSLMQATGFPHTRIAQGDPHLTTENAGRMTVGQELFNEVAALDPKWAGEFYRETLEILND